MLRSCATGQYSHPLWRVYISPTYKTPQPAEVEEAEPGDKKEEEEATEVEEAAEVAMGVEEAEAREVTQGVFHMRSRRSLHPPSSAGTAVRLAI